MREVFARMIAAVAASALPALIFSAAVGDLGVFVIAFVFALAHALVLGLPISAVLMHTRFYKAGAMLLAGAFAGILPMAVLILPAADSFDLAGLQFLAAGAAFGASGGIAFYFTHRGISPNHPFKPSPSARFNPGR